MNLLLLHPQDLTSDNTAKVTDRRLEHVLKIHRSNVGDSLRVGLINDKIGTGIITKLNKDALELEFKLTKEAPAPLPVTLVIALPRPQMLKRILQTVATMGVKKLIFIHSNRVEKSFWQTPELAEDKVKRQLLLGLEQGIDTSMPEVECHHKFKTFVEDVLPGLCQGKRALLAHPGVEQACPAASSEETVLVIGPEGGFIPYEVEKLKQEGCQSFHLGERILKVETAVSVLLGKLFP